MRPRILALLTAALTASLMMGVAARADDPPERVGRISYLEGTVSFHAADQGDWSFAQLNYPVLAGNSFWTQPDARSEIQIGALEIRMDNATEMQVSQLDEATTTLNVPQGVIDIHFATPPLSGTVQVVTPNGTAILSQPGTYHIDSGHAAPGTSPQVQVSALEGQMEFRTPQAVLQVMRGEAAIVNGNPPSFSLVEAAPSPFDDWALARERRETAHIATQYVSPHVTGYEDLDYYGQWSGSPAYGMVWYPTVVPAGWEPYRYGHWAFIAPWGWTWVDDAPWGFAPFHYGRWAYVDGRWGWAPGQIVERPVYAPALVAFIGGAGWSVTLSSGETPAVGWVPLGPHEVFHPYYPASPAYLHAMNYAHARFATNSNNHGTDGYANIHAATVVSQDTFRHGQQVRTAALPLPEAKIAQTPISPTVTHLQPQPEAMRPSRGEHHEVQPQIVRPVQTQQPEIHHEMQAKQPYDDQQRPVNVQTIPEHKPLQPIIYNNEQHANEQHGQSLHAPGPAINHMAPQEQPHIVQVQPRELPVAPVPHPEQHAPIQPTPQGWQRMQQPHDQPHPQPVQQQHPQPQQHDGPHPGQPPNGQQSGGGR